MDDKAKFFFFTCQVGAENALKAELGRLRPELRFAFSRPGFLTFKLPPQMELPEDFRLRAVFARSYGFAVGRASIVQAAATEPPSGGDEAAPRVDLESLAREVWQLAPARDYQRIHVWPRDVAEPERRGYEPSMTPEAIDLHAALRRCCPNPAALAAEDGGGEGFAGARPAAAGQLVLDCIIVDPGVCWVGYHRAGAFSSRWPGGMMPLELPADAVSRAWLKMEEALRWSRLPIPAGARVAEIGSAPGGASQALLARGLLVTGIDPAEMSPVVLANPNFTHIRRRAVQVRRRDFRKIRWLTADMNVAPKYTLDVIEAIVAREDANVRGMLLTLKLSDWSLARHIPEYLQRIRSWGYEVVRARQLLYNRREICVAAMRRAARRAVHKHEP
jgi:23S rRNA (cytidine2498-2'-O)-methyltransferase